MGFHQIFRALGMEDATSFHITIIAIQGLAIAIDVLTIAVIYRLYKMTRVKA
jgi:hypothetical protein